MTAATIVGTGPSLRGKSVADVRGMCICVNRAVAWNPRPDAWVFRDRAAVDMYAHVVLAGMVSCPAQFAHLVSHCSDWVDPCDRLWYFHGINRTMEQAVAVAAMLGATVVYTLGVDMVGQEHYDGLVDPESNNYRWNKERAAMVHAAQMFNVQLIGPPGEELCYGCNESYGGDRCGSDECHGWCPRCGARCELVRPGKSQTVCGCWPDSGSDDE